jgi:hypothetical protein
VTLVWHPSAARSGPYYVCLYRDRATGEASWYARFHHHCLGMADSESEAKALCETHSERKNHGKKGS